MIQGAPRRFPIRYAIQRWNDGKWFYGSFFLILLVLVAINLFQQHQIISFIPVLVLDLAILVSFWLMRSFSYVEIAEDSLRVRYLFRHVELPYTALSRVRRQPLEVAFQPAERRLGIKIVLAQQVVVSVVREIQFVEDKGRVGRDVVWLAQPGE